MNDKPYLTSKDVAKKLRVSTVTVRQWAQKGMLSAETTPGGHRRFSHHEVQRFAQSHNITLLRSDDRFRILIVDDNSDMAICLCEMLLAISNNIDVETAQDGFDAGRQVSSFKPHVVMLDLKMPGMDGFEVCRLLKSNPETCSIRIIAMTGFPTPETEKRIQGLGAEMCLSKPFTQVEMLEAVGLIEQAIAYSN